MVHYKLTYYAFYGLGEPSRQLFALANVDFEDHRVRREEWAALKNSTPFGQMPVLEVDGKQLAQSKAIARYLAHQFGFAGETLWEQAQVDAWGDQISDYMNEVLDYFHFKVGYTPGDAEAAYQTQVIPARERFFPIAVKQLMENGSGFLVGNKVSWADLFLIYHVETFRNCRPEYVDDYPGILAHFEKVRAIPELKKWLEKRPEAQY
ncbi:unnamed protein product, partial [Mesorhabditis spiculigera]